MQRVVIKRNPIFEPLWASDKRYVVMLGSAGSGKSVDTAQFYITRVLSQKGRNLLCIRKVAQSNAVSTFNELKKAIYKMGLASVFTFKLNPLQIDCSNGNQILFGGVNDDGQREKLKSITPSNGSLTDVWIEEATEITQADFEIIDDRLRGLLPVGLFYQIRLSFNPVSSSHWIKKVFFDRVDSNVITSKSTYKDNMFCDEAYYQRMERRKEVDPDGYRIYGLGEWGETSGLIFSNYVVEEFSKKENFFDYRRYGQDFGFNHANAILDIGFKDDEVYICREIYEREKTTEDIIKQAQGLDKSIVMWCDCAEPDRIISWQRAGYNAVGVYKYSGSVNASIDWLKQRKIHIHPDCVGAISEISQWRWKKDKDGNYTDVPVPFGDDAMAALRYGVCEFIARDALPPEKLEKPIYNFNVERPKPTVGCEKVVVF
ncbi:MAG: PBSX family phage terminase large subunit [Oscillospiraceae bacterium]